MEKMRPIYDRLYIERIDKDEKTAGGLYIPESSKKNGQTGKVVAAGSGKISPEGTVRPLQVKVGDVVFFEEYAGTEINDKFLILKEDDVLAVVE